MAPYPRRTRWPGSRRWPTPDPDVLLRPGVVHFRRPPAARPGTRARRLLRRRRAQLARHPARWRRRHRCWRPGSWTACRRSTSTRYAIDRTRTPRDRTPDSGTNAPSSSSASCSATRSARPGSPGPPATCGVLRCTTVSSPRAPTSGSRRAGSSPSGSTPDGSSSQLRLWTIAARPAMTSSAVEHAAVREAVGIMDMTLMAKFMVQGPDAAAVLSRLSANDVDPRDRPRGLHPVAERGRAASSPTSPSPAWATSSSWWWPPTSFTAGWSRWSAGRAVPGEFVTVTDVTSGTTLLTVQGPASRQLLSRLSRRRSSETTPSPI